MHNLQKLFDEFLTIQGSVSYAAVYEALVSSDEYDPVSNEMYEVGCLVKQDYLDEAHAHLQKAMVNLLLSPDAHYKLSLFSRMKGDLKNAEIEAMIAQICCAGIVSTGKGNKEKPYRIARLSDEYDVLSYLGREYNNHKRFESGDKVIECVGCEEGDLIWFDITDIANFISTHPQIANTRNAPAGRQASWSLSTI